MCKGLLGFFAVYLVPLDVSSAFDHFYKIEHRALGTGSNPFLLSRSSITS